MISEQAKVREEAFVNKQKDAVEKLKNLLSEETDKKQDKDLSDDKAMIEVIEDITGKTPESMLYNIWNKDVKEQEILLRKAMEKFPDNSYVLGSYAIFFWDQKADDHKADYKQAEEYYKKAIEADPKNANNVDRYNTFLKRYKENHDEAK